MKLEAQCLVAFVTVAVLVVVGWMYYAVINAVILSPSPAITDQDNVEPSRAVQFYNNTIVGDSTTTDGHQESQGHIFVYSSFKKQTSGAINLWRLEIWAKLMNMKVAEPFAVDSILGIVGAAPHFNQVLRFRDYYDIEKWNLKVIKHGGSPLIKWEEFLSGAPHQAIILYTSLRPLGKPLIVTYGAKDIKKYHDDPHVQISDDAMVWINNNFNVTRVVNIIYSTFHRAPMTFETLYSHIFGGLMPSEVTLICVNWIGIGADNSNLALSSFQDLSNVIFNYPLNSHSVQLEISPSQRILRAYKDYVSKYFGNRKYVGVVRAVPYLLPGNKNDFDKQTKYLLNCSRTLRNVIENIRSKWGIFLAYEVGEDGSKNRYYNLSDQKIASLHDQIFLDIFNNSLNIKQREEMLLKAAGGITDRGFITELERTIAVHADCIVLFGKGSSSLASDYVSLHDSSHRCVVSICSGVIRDQNGIVISSHNIPDIFLNS